MREKIVGTIISYVNIIIQVIVNLVYIPLLLKYLGKDAYGIYQYFLVIISYMSIIEGGLSNSIIRFYTEYTQQKKFIKAANLLAMAIRIYIIICVILFIIGIFIYLNLNNVIAFNLIEKSDIKFAFLILLFNLVVSIGSVVFTAILNVNEKFIQLRLLTLISNIVPVIIIVLLVGKYNTILLIAITQFIINILINVYKFYYCKNFIKVKIELKQWNWGLFKRIISLSSSVLLVMIADQLFWRSNLLILGFYNRLDDIVIYSIATSIFINFITIGNVIPGIFSVKFLKLLSERRNLSQIFLQISRYQFILLGLIFSGFCIFGKEFISLWIGKEYIIVYFITIIFLLAIMIDLCQSMLQVIMQFNNIYWYKSYIYIVLSIINLAVISFLISIFNVNIVTIAIVTAMLMFMGNSLFLNYICYKKLSVNLKKFWIESLINLLKLLMVIIFAYFINEKFIIDSIVILICKITIYTFLFVIIAYNFMLNKTEKNFLKQFLRRRLCA